MNLNKKIFILIIFLGVISLSGAYCAFNQENPVVNAPNNNETDMIGCCSIVLQLDGNDTLMSYRRDSDLDANIHIENVNWHGYNAIKQYKTDNNYFCHVIVTSDGWVIGLGGTDDGIDNQIAENITANMINDNNTISKSDLEKIQKLKEPYGKGHVVIKAPNGNYGFATVDKLKTGKLVPGQFISIPNDYQYSRGDNITIDVDDKIKSMNNLSRSDLYGLDRREIITYNVHIGENNNTTDIYAANEDGGLIGVNNSIYIDDIYVNDTVIHGEDIPLAPDYIKIGSVTFSQDNNAFGKLFTLILLVVFVVFVGVLTFVAYKFVRFIKSKF
ncbi:MAG: hypothetical protein U0L42_07490 [Methanobrevibacter sp.]|uniref:hypothetical protein n=1 Tax=Methanobrevibacter sp. TaxID=66852 RepID=UPI002E7A6B4E|nr:hypothetical protein [Methanobrevibacter sp.]MEE0935498.1 hypothetical protein [Methanobrevibacter sp.]